MTIDLGGTRVLAIGMRYDAMAAGVIALTDAGAEVVVYPIGPGEMFGEEWEIVTEDDRARFEERFDLKEGEIPEGQAGLTVVETLGGAQVADALSEGAAMKVWADAHSRLGGIDVVYLSPWYGFASYEVHRQLLAAMAESGGGQMIVTQFPHGDDQTILNHHGLARGLRNVAVVVLAEPPARDLLIERVVLDELSGPVTVLIGAGWSPPLTLSYARRWASAQLSQGDALAGHRWTDVGNEHVDSGLMVIGDAAHDVDPSVRDVLLNHTDVSRQTSYTWDLPFFRFGTGGDWPVWVEAITESGTTTALRFLIEDGTPEPGSDPAVRYSFIGHLDVSAPGKLRISDPAYLDASPGRILDVRPGRWVVETGRRQGATVWYRIRHIHPFDPDPFAGTDGIDREHVANLLATSLSRAATAPGSALADCKLDHRRRRPILSLRSGDIYEIAIAFGTTPLQDLADDPNALQAMSSELLEIQPAAPMDEEWTHPRTIDDVRPESPTVAAVDLAMGSTIRIGLRHLAAPLPVVGVRAPREPADLNGQVSSCQACGGTAWSTEYGMPTSDDFYGSGVPEWAYGGCAIDLSGPIARCADCGWTNMPPDPDAWNSNY